jgi:hypothetical protein
METSETAASSTFSDELEGWLGSDEHKTIGEMSDVFGERGFAVAVVLAMSIPALPLPTGGISHVFEILALLVGVEMVLGLHELWLPGWLKRRELGAILEDKALPFIVRRVRWCEKRSKRRGAALFDLRWFRRLLGLLVIALVIASAVAPPFSGLDTLPAMGAVVVALAILLGDVVLLGVGILLGTGGVILMITVGAALARLVTSIF